MCLGPALHLKEHPVRGIEGLVFHKWGKEEEEGKAECATEEAGKERGRQKIEKRPVTSLTHRI